MKRLGQRIHPTCALLLVGVFTGDVAAGGPEAASGLDACAAIPANSHVTGLFFNPEGMQTYYERARCYQELAVRLRDSALCARVEERRSWFLDGSAISSSACREAVAAQQRRDVATAARMRPPQHLRDIAVVRDNNGRDFDVLVRTTGGNGVGLWLTLVLIDATGRRHMLHSAPQPMDDRPAELSIFIPVERVPATPPGGTLRLQASLERKPADADERAVLALAKGLALRSSAETQFAPAALQRTLR
jgi:hypothetical protein